MEAVTQQSKEVQEMNDKQSVLETAATRMESVVMEAGVDKRNVKAALADVCRIKVQSIHGWFNGTTKNPSAIHIAAVAVHYGADPIWLITGTPSPGAGASYSETIRYSPSSPGNIQEEEIHCTEVVIKRVFK